MPSPLPWQVQFGRSRRVAAAAATLALALLAATISLTTLQVRTAIRRQMVSRDAAILQAVTQTALDQRAAEWDAVDPDTPPPDLLTAVLLASRLKGVLATRLMDPNGRFIEAFPVSARESNLPHTDLGTLQRFEPISRFHDQVPAAVLFYPDPDRPDPGTAMPVLEVDVPLRGGPSGPLLGIAQFLIEGHSMATEFRRLDRHLAYQGAAAFAVFGSLLAAALTWAYRRLQHTHRLLAERTSRLVRAHQDLTLAAKTSAVGALASHLIHGLKSPLAGLQRFVAEAQRDRPDADATDWAQAATSARRMQTLIQDVVNVLREEESAAHYELTLDELAAVIQQRVQPHAQARGVQLAFVGGGDPALDNHTANLVAFILVNLLDNAIDATPAGRTVECTARPLGDAVLWTVHDHGPGFPDGLRSDPFLPRTSSKPGGSGIGLAISKQLAGHLAARLELTQSSPDGSTLELEVPLPHTPR